MDFCEVQILEGSAIFLQTVSIHLYLYVYVVEARPHAKAF